VVAVEVVRVGRQHRDPALVDVRTVQVGRRWRDARVGVRRIARALLDAPAPHASPCRTGLPLGGSEPVHVPDVRRVGRDERVPLAHQCLVEQLPQLQLDFKKGHLGVEVQFNNAASLEHTVFKLNTAFRDPRVLAQDLILVGVLVLASKRLKRWGSMDDTVRAFESAEDKLELLRSSVAAPLIVVGLDADDDWPDVSPSFPGTSKGGGKG